VCHEVLHCALGHPWRRSGREPKKWNIATDLIINAIVLETVSDTGKRLVLPGEPRTVREFYAGQQGYLLDNEYSKLSEEHAYARLPDPPQRTGDGKGEQKNKSDGAGVTGPNGEEPTDVDWGAVLDGEGETKADDEANWKIATVQAAQSALSRGNLPGSLKRLVEEITRNKMDWKSALMRFVQHTLKTDYSWQMPSPRYAAQGLYLPKMHNEQLPPIVVMTDASGSCYAAHGTFFSELSYITAQCNPEKVYHCQWDIRKQGKVEEYEPGDVIKTEYRGGSGGTNFSKAFEWIEERNIAPACIIFFTDCYTVYPKNAPDAPVIWVSTVRYDKLPDKYKPPFGEFLYIGDDL
jgi:predicted metal-dependent peptidase